MGIRTVISTSCRAGDISIIEDNNGTITSASFSTNEGKGYLERILNLNDYVLNNKTFTLKELKENKMTNDEKLIWAAAYSAFFVEKINFLQAHGKEVYDVDSFNCAELADLALEKFKHVMQEHPDGKYLDAYGKFEI